MQTDVSTIKYDQQTNLVTMPLVTYEEIRQFCRQHGETDLPGWGNPEPFTAFSDDYMDRVATEILDMISSASQG